MVGKFAAIPGGMDIEQTYQLIDTYIQECEKLQTEEAVKNLQYNMLIDFAKRVAQQKLPAGISQEVYLFLRYACFWPAAVFRAEPTRKGQIHQMSYPRPPKPRPPKPRPCR